MGEPDALNSDMVSNTNPYPLKPSFNKKMRADLKQSPKRIEFVPLPFADNRQVLVSNMY